MLREAARSTASWSIRNMGTVGGNLFTPPPGGDVAVALLALDASVALASAGGERVLPLADFFTGFMTNALATDELLVEVAGADPERTPTAFIKFGRKHANTPAVVTVAVRLAWDGERVADARIALGAVGPHPIRARQAERVLVGTQPRRGRDRGGRRRGRRGMRAVHRRHRHRLVPTPDGPRLRRPGARAAGAGHRGGDR